MRRQFARKPSRLLAPRQDPLASPDLQMLGTLLLRPSFDHWIKIECPGFSGTLHHAQMERMERLFEAARAEIEADSYRNDDRLYLHAVPLGRF